MAAATLPLSRSMRIPLANRQDTANFPSSSADDSDWGPSSVPPSSNPSVPWDDQVVPALRKKLEAESQNISKRISRIEESDSGWARGMERRMSREVVKSHQRESSIDQWHNRFATVRTPSRQNVNVVDTSFPFDASTWDQNAGERSPGAGSRDSEATQRAREKARQIAARRAQQMQNGTSRDTTLSRQTGLGESSIDMIPEHNDGNLPSSPPASGASFERKRLRTQSTPMRPSLDVSNAAPMPERRAQNASTQQPSNRSGHQRTSSLSRKKAAALDPQLMAEFGPLGHTPSPTAKLLRAHLDPSSPSTASPSRQPDAFGSLSGSRRLRETSAPPMFANGGELSEFGVSIGASPGSKSVNSWEDQIIPTVARKMQQEEFLAAAKANRYEGLIDTWDRNGLPLSQSDVRARKLLQQQQREAEQEEERKKAAAEEEEKEEEQVLQPGPIAQMARREQLSPVDATFDGRSRSRASSRRSQRSAHSQQHQLHEAQQQRDREWEERQLQEQRRQAEAMQMQHMQPSHIQSMQPRPQQQRQAVQPPNAKQSAWEEDKVDKSGCCCIVM